MNMLDNMFGVKELHTMPMNTSTLTKLKISFVYCTVHVPPEVESYRYCRILPYFRVQTDSDVLFFFSTVTTPGDPSHSAP